MNQTDLSSFQNTWYKPGRNKIWMIFWYFINAIIFRNPLIPLSSFKIRILRIFGAIVGEGVVIKPSVNIKYPWRLSIGKNTWIGENVWIDNLANVSIGANACISQGAMLLTGNHNYKLSSFDLIIKDIVIEDGAWIGAQTVVCPGVSVGSHAVLSVGSIATSDLQAYSIYSGNPAIKVRDRIIEK